ERSVNHLVAETLTRDGRIAPQARTRARSGVKRTGIRLMPLMKFERSRSTGPATSMSGRRRSSSSNITRISRHARLAPRQKWGQSEMVVGGRADVEARGGGDPPLVAVRGGVEQDQLVALADALPAELDVARGRALEEVDGRHPAQHLLDRR